MPLNIFYTMVQKSQKWPKTQIKGGPALNWFKMNCLATLVQALPVFTFCKRYTSSDSCYSNIYSGVGIQLCS